MIAEARNARPSMSDMPWLGPARLPPSRSPRSIRPWRSVRAVERASEAWAIPNQIDIAKQVKRAGDRKRKIEAHGGARRRTFKDIEAAKYDSSDGGRE